jgi:hypothetical protein
MEAETLTHEDGKIATAQEYPTSFGIMDGKCSRCLHGCKMRGVYCLPCYENIKTRVESDRESTVQVRALSGRLVVPSGLRACKGCWQVSTALGMVHWVYQTEEGENRSPQTPTRFYVGTLELGPSEPLGMFGDQVTCGFTTESNATAPYFDVPAADLSNVSTPRTPSMDGQDST